MDKMHKRTDAQKKADKAYNTKSLNFTVCYRPGEIAQGKRLKEYLKESNQSVNAYLKKLIADDLNSKGIPYPDNTNQPDNTDQNED